MLASLSRKAERKKAQFDNLSPGRKAISGLGFLLVGLALVAVAYVIKDTNWGESSRFGSTTVGIQFFAVLGGAAFTFAALDMLVRAAPDQIRRWLGYNQLGRIMNSDGFRGDFFAAVFMLCVLAIALGIIGYMNGWF